MEGFFGGCMIAAITIMIGGLFALIPWELCRDRGWDLTVKNYLLAIPLSLGSLALMILAIGAFMFLSPLVFVGACVFAVHSYRKGDDWELDKDMLKGIIPMSLVLGLFVVGITGGVLTTKPKAETDGIAPATTQVEANDG